LFKAGATGSGAALVGAGAATGGTAVAVGALVGMTVGVLGAAGTSGVVEHAASSNITLQLKTTNRLNMVILLRHIG
jgi:hypothetical protein